MDSHHHQQSGLTASDSGFFHHGLSAEHTPSTDARLLFCTRRSRKRSASTAVSLGHADNSDYKNPSPVNISGNHDIHSPVGSNGRNSGADTYATAIQSAKATTTTSSRPANFVTKLYCMINDPKSAKFIIWTNVGTSFVVSNISEFSRTILGCHFRHNNFSSFVRQLNMYGFHKVKHISHAQHDFPGNQAWEFSHKQFIRGRSDLLNHIRRKAPHKQNLTKKHHTEHHTEQHPSNVAAQIGAIRSDYQNLWQHFCLERKSNERLSCIINRLWDFTQNAFPGSIPLSPNDIFGSVSNDPNIYVTSPTSAKYPPPPSINFNPSLHPVPTPGASPTCTDFPHSPPYHPVHSSLSRQQNFQPVIYAFGGQAATSASRLTNAADTTSPSPSPMQDVHDNEHLAGCGNGVNSNAPSMGLRGITIGIQQQRLSDDELSAMSPPHGLGMHVNMNGYSHHQQPHGHPGQYGSAAHSYHAHHLVEHGSTVSSPGTTTAPSSFLSHLQDITVAGGVHAGLGSGVANSVGGVKRSSRARGDSAPSGPYTYASSAASLAGSNTLSPGGTTCNVGTSWFGGRPRSRSELVTLGQSGPGIVGIPSGIGFGNMTGLANLATSGVSIPSQPLLPGPHDADAMNIS